MVQICGDTQCRYVSINSQFYPNKSWSQECSTHSQHCERMRCDAPPWPPTAHLLPLVPRRAPVDAKVFPWESWPPASFCHANTESFNDSVTKRDTKSLWSTSWSSQLNLDTSLLQMHCKCTLTFRASTDFDVSGNYLAHKYILLITITDHNRLWKDSNSSFIGS